MKTINYLTNLCLLLKTDIIKNCAGILIFLKNFREKLYIEIPSDNAIF